MNLETQNRLRLFALVQALYFGIFAITSYQNVFLQKEGLSSAQIGMIVSIASVAGLVVSPIWGAASDRRRSAKGTFLLSVATTVVLFALMPFLGRIAGSRFGFYVSYIPLIFAFKQVSNAMLDSWCIADLAPRGVSYGSARMWGSIGYSISSLLMGMAVGKWIPLHSAFEAMLPLLAVLLLVSSRIRMARSERERTPQPGKRNIGLLLKNRRFLTYCLYALGLNIYLAITLIFMPYILEAASCQAAQIGTVTGVRALMEIVSMYLSARLCKKIPIRYIMLLPGVLFGIEHLCYRFAHGLASMMGIMVISGLAGGFFYSLGPSYVFEIVHPSVVNTAQTINTMNLMLVSVVGSALGGVAIEAYGIHAVTTFCGVLILALTVLFGISVYKKQ